MQAATIASQSRLYINKSEQIILNADDYGCNENIDLGIFQLLQNGSVSSISVMINGPNIVKAAERINQLILCNSRHVGNFSVGLHFNLTEGRPLSEDILHSNLIQNGQFIGKAEFYQIIAKDEGRQSYQIAAEFKSQIKQFIKIFKRRPSHVDGHNHIHIFPKIAKIIASIMTQMGIYRTRILHEQLQTFHIPFNTLFLSNSKLSQRIYSERGIIFPSRFVGLEGFGNVYIKNIQKAITFTKNSSDEYRTIEVMCHPGIPATSGNPWICNKDRLAEKQQLQSEQFHKFISENGGLSSYLDLKNRIKTNKLRALIYSKMQSGTGNQTTALRFKNILEQINFEVYIWSVHDHINPSIEAYDMEHFIMNFGISIVFGINVSRSAQIIYQATCETNSIKMVVPYVLVIAGTDANITFKDQQKLKHLYSALTNSICFISLSHDMTNLTKQTLDRLKMDKRIYTIVQSSGLSKSSSTTQESIGLTPPISFLKQYFHIDLDERPFILFPTSFRKVKCVHHLFAELNYLIDEQDIDVFIAGPVLDQQYYDQHKGQLGRIRYIGVVSRQIYCQLLQKAFLVLNTSESEGMSCSILEAFQFQVPVIARKNSGNQQLITHRHNGLIYTSPEQFCQLFRELKSNILLRTEMIHNSAKLIVQKYSYDSELKLFQNLIKAQLLDKTCVLATKTENIRVLNRRNIHPTSDVNNSIFMQIEPELQDGDSIIDLGAGTGIFGLIFLLKSKAANLAVYLTDIESQITGHSLYNYCQSSLWNRIKSVTCLKSNLFQKVDATIHYKAILVNPPQTPFRMAESRPDKNGGPDGIKFYEPILEYFAKSTIEKLYLLHSFMGWPAKFKELLKRYGLSIVWESSRVTHRINKSDYDEMEPGLSSYIESHIAKGQAEVEIQGQTFYVPAVIYCIVRASLI